MTIHRADHHPLRLRHGDSEKQIQCGENLIHGNTVAEILATFPEGRVEREERLRVLSHLLFLAEFLQRGLREFKMRYSAASIPVTFSSLAAVALAEEAQCLRVSSEAGGESSFFRGLQ
jgi:hypothetical protein